MVITRKGFNLLVLVWILPMLVIDVYGNTINTGFLSKVYFFAVLFHGMLAAYAVYQVSRENNLFSQGLAEKKVADPNDTVVSFKDLNAIEYIYCAILCVAALVALVMHYALNEESTGFTSIVTLLWSVLDLGIIVLSGYQFYILKSGAIVEGVKSLTQGVIETRTNKPAQPH